jgi:DHA1 family quinolone resistance protein-like MFS transporter
MKELTKLIPIQFFSNAALFASMIFIPILAGELDASDFEVGLIVASYAFALFISNYIFGRYSDIHGKRIFLQLGLILSSAACLLQILASGVLTLTLSRILVGFCAGIYPSALLAKAFILKQDRIGRFTSFGSFGWAFGILIAAILTVYWQIFLFSSLMFFLCFLFSLVITFKDEVKMAVPLFPKSVIKKSFPVYLTILVRHMGASSVWVIFPLYLHVNLGASLTEIGILYALNPIGQFLTMQFVDRYQSTKLIPAGLVLSIICFSMLTFITTFWLVVIPWVLLSVGWAFLYVGSLKFVMERNIEKATSTGLLNSTLGISSILGATVGGVVAWQFGRVANIFLAVILCSVATVLFFVLLRRVDEEQNNR